MVAALSQRAWLVRGGRSITFDLANLLTAAYRQIGTAHFRLIRNLQQIILRDLSLQVNRAL